ncbi:carboxymuconolactone decarboxylase [Suhomyces tanzawaensis NRRL Y-17324]|uniref:Carboxymuconolactone decarboxylase n=1 Tax=Suhomyces tanzawaensis NRRL Y-17324 TaxID=984487 RepID=A0A1E4SID1_9ASCO|nr:carboxymuconolactone decarboxylase [Suhomyces tanzawaensis NRRL Y-17324]ODV79182.1 carboxymuconolactone decarboxylase [Suhomyces tanzawaensis NRRL Y-17324]
MILTAERLVRLAYKYPSLHNSWYLIACACLTVVNQPQEIPSVFHFALRQQLLESTTDTSLLTNKFLIQMAQDSISSSTKYKDLTAVGVNLPDILIPYSYYDKLPLKFKYSSSDDILACQSQIAAKVREVILKSVALAGLPKAINALMILKTVTPTAMKPSTLPVRPCIVKPGHVPSSDIVGEDLNGTNFDQSADTKETIDGPISPSSINVKRIQEDLYRGSEFWNAIYTSKVNTRIKRQMVNAYPDLWYFAYHNVYSPLLSFTEVLSARETSMCVVASLIPQDVNPQLKGHLKGAYNVGVSKEELSDLRDLVFDVCDWTGGVTWADGKEGVAKL